MTGLLLQNGKFQGIGSDGKVVALGSLEINHSSSGLPATTYRDSGKTSTNTQPILLSGSGKADVYLVDGTYDLILKDQYGEVVWSVENYISNLSNIYTKDETYSQTEIDSLLSKSISEWLIPLFSVVYVSAATFTIIGDKTSTYLLERRLKINLSASSVYSAVLSSVYDSGSDITTITIKDAVITPTLTTVYHSIIAPLEENGSVTPEMVGIYYDRSLVKNIILDSDLTLTTKENWYGRIEITDTDTILTAPINIILDNSEHSFTFTNSTAQDLTVKNPSGTGIIVAPTKTSELRNNTTNIIDNAKVDETNLLHTVGNGGGNPEGYTTSEVDAKIISTVTSNVLLNQDSLSQSVSPNYTETSTTTTADYVVGDIIRDTSSSIMYDCTADSTSGALLTDTTYFAINTSNVLSVTAGNFTYTEGIGENGYVRSSEQVTGSIDFTGVSDGLKWVGKDKAGSYQFFDTKPSIGLYEKTSASDNRLVFDTETGKWNTTTGGELVTNGTFDVDVSGWTDGGDCTGSFDSGKLRITSTTTASTDGVHQVIDTEVGTEYLYTYTYIPGTRANIQIHVNNIMVNNHTTFGTYTYTFTAVSTTTKIEFVLNTTDTTYDLVDDISVYKLEATLDTPLITPISFLPEPVMVASETPMDIRKDQGMVLTNVMDSASIGTLKVTDGFYLGQTWQDVLVNRAFNIIYTNNSNKPIEISISLSSNVSGFASLYIDNIRQSSLNGSQRGQLASIVPPGITYEVVKNIDTITLEYWAELR